MVCVDIDSSSRHNPEATTFTVGEKLEVNKSKTTLPFQNGEDRVVSFFQSEFQENIRLNFQNSGDIKKQFQRKATVHSWGFYRGQMLAADTDCFCKLLLC